jgi:hypothetical protein
MVKRPRKRPPKKAPAMLPAHDVLIEPLLSQNWPVEPELQKHFA